MWPRPEGSQPSLPDPDRDGFGSQKLQQAGPQPQQKLVGSSDIVVRKAAATTLCQGPEPVDPAAVLRPEGLLVVTELCSHDQAWAREFCGDLWLGFNSDQINRWCEIAKLTEVTSSHLAQRNGFQIQVRLYTRQK